MAAERFDVVVVGAGLRGLAAALRAQRAGRRVLAIDARPQPGGRAWTQRSNGFVCELGAFGFDAAELAPLLQLLQPAPALLSGRCTHGAVFDGERLLPVEVEPRPVSFRSGNEELAQACRRALGPALRLGRAVTTIESADAGFRHQLGGEAAGELFGDELVLALPPWLAGRLMAPFDARLANAAEHVDPVPHALVFLGAAAAEAPELRGHGIVPADGVRSDVAEIVFCSEVFAGRALPGRTLVRVELAGARAAATDDAAVEAAVAVLRSWTGTRAVFGFTKVHRFDVPQAAGALAECRLRLAELPARVPGLRIAADLAGA